MVYMKRLDKSFCHDQFCWFPECGSLAAPPQTAYSVESHEKKKHPWTFFVRHFFKGHQNKLFLPPKDSWHQPQERSDFQKVIFRTFPSWPIKAWGLVLWPNESAVCDYLEETFGFNYQYLWSQIKDYRTNRTE